MIHHRINLGLGLAIGLLGTGMAFHAMAFQEMPADQPISLSGLSASHAYSLEDESPFDPNGEIVIRLLYRVGKVSPASLTQFGEYSREVSFSEVIDNPKKYRFWVWNTAGRIQRITPVSLPESDAQAGLAGYYEIDLQTDNGPAKLLSRTLPRSWRNRDANGQFVSATGFFLKLQRPNPQSAPAGVFVCNRVAWFPDSENTELGVTLSHVRLAQAGFDVSLLDSARRENAKQLGTTDADCFYQMLSKSQNITVEQFPKSTVQFPVLIQKGGQHIGDAVQLQGKVRRCVRIEIDSPTIQQTTGLTHYYELDMFYLLDGQKVVIGGSDEATLEYEDRFPFTVCLPSLPDGMNPADVENRVIDIRGFFFRFWKYASEFTQAQGGQVSPLIIGLPIEIPPSQEALLNRILTWALLLIVLLGAVFTWYYLRTEKVDSQQAKQQRRLPDQLDFDPAELD